jgi:hypothetical protein
MEGSAFKALDNPVRRHDADGFVPPSLESLVSAITPENRHAEVFAEPQDAAKLALEFVSDCASFEGYAHALPEEVANRARRIAALLKPKVCERPSGVGYDAPPPARCEFCDES